MLLPIPFLVTVLLKELSPEPITAVLSLFASAFFIGELKVLFSSTFIKLFLLLVELPIFFLRGELP